MPFASRFTAPDGCRDVEADALVRDGDAESRGVRTVGQMSTSYHAAGISMKTAIAATARRSVFIESSIAVCD